jgi:hypothetical protein
VVCDAALSGAFGLLLSRAALVSFHSIEHQVVRCAVSSAATTLRLFPWDREVGAPTRDAKRSRIPSYAACVRELSRRTLGGSGPTYRRGAAAPSRQE